MIAEQAQCGRGFYKPRFFLQEPFYETSEVLLNYS